jgi:hypothetical protein
VFAQAASDEEFQRVRYVDENDGLLSTIASSSAPVQGLTRWTAHGQ